MLISKIFCIQDKGSVLHRIGHLYNLHFHSEGEQHLMHVGLAQMIRLLMTLAKRKIADFSNTMLSGGSQSQYTRPKTPQQHQLTTFAIFLVNP